MASKKATKKPVRRHTKLENLVYETIGAASMCWSRKPKGIFDSNLAAQLGDKLIKEINKRLHRKKAAKKRSIIKSSISGRFVSKAAAKDNPYSTYTTKRK